jgi:hypothetical protein
MVLNISHSEKWVAFGRLLYEQRPHEVEKFSIFPIFAWSTNLFSWVFPTHYIILSEVDKSKINVNTARADIFKSKTNLEEMSTLFIAFLKFFSVSGRHWNVRAKPRKYPWDGCGVAQKERIVLDLYSETCCCCKRFESHFPVYLDNLLLQALMFK